MSSHLRLYWVAVIHISSYPGILPLNHVLEYIQLMQWSYKCKLNVVYDQSKQQKICIRRL